jgi:hypothetical protein
MPVSQYNADDPLAFFITWTMYGTWLPGDQRGWNQKRVGGFQLPDPVNETAARKRMPEPAFQICDDHKEIVRSTVLKHCEIRGWHFHVVNPRSNHVHVVVTASSYDPKSVMEQFKTWCTRNLKSAGVQRENFWTEGGSKRCVNTEEELQRVIFYASEGQDRKGRDK